MKPNQKLIVEVIDARNLQPKDGHGTSSPYVVIDFYGQRKRTPTIIRDLNPTWNSVLEFNVGKPSDVFGDMLELDVFHDKNYGPTRRHNHLGRIKLCSTQFVKKGEEALIYYPLERKYLLSWIQGEIGLKIYFQDEITPLPPPSPSPPLPPPPAAEESKNEANNETTSPEPTAETTPPQEKSQEGEVKADAEAGPSPPPPGQASETAAEPLAENAAAPLQVEKPPEEAASPPPPEEQQQEPAQHDDSMQNNEIMHEEDDIMLESPEIMASTVSSAKPEVKVAEINGPHPIPRPLGPTALEPQESMSIERSSFDLVEKMHYAFVRVVKARYLPTNGNPVVRVVVSSSRI